MDRIGKIKKYLEILGYKEDRIEKIINNPKYCNAIYSRIVAYEVVLNVDPIQTYENLNRGRKR